MASMRIVIIFLFLFNFLSINLLAQVKTPTIKEVKQLTKQATKYREDGNYEKSLLSSRLALHKAISLKNNELIAENYNNVAANLNELIEFDKAIFYYNKALLYANYTNNDTLKQRVNNNLGNMYCFEKKKYEVGLKFYEKALEYSSKIADSTAMAFTNLNIAWVYFDIKRFNEGKKNLDFANKYYKNHPDNSTIVVHYMLNGMFNNYLNNDKKAELYFKEAIAIGKKRNLKTDLSYSYLEYSKFLLKIKEYKSAYENLSRYNILLEESYAEEKLEKANVEGINFVIDEYKRTIDKIETEKDLQYKSLKKSRVIVLLFIIALFVLLLFLNTLIKNNRFKIKSNANLMIANAELIIANKKAEESSVLKTQFVSTITHELRTPLYGVVGITDLLLEEHDELASSPHLKSLKFSARYLLSLVNDILQINKIEENKITLDKLTFNLSDEINMIKNSLSFIAQKNNNTVNVLIDPLIPDSLIGDKLRLGQILMNLVSNALKFTKNGTILITAKQVNVKEKFHTIAFEIQDDGIGIDHNDQNKIFDKFVQIGRKEDDYQGTGLGLAIVKKLLKLFKSSISVKSQLGKGTTFSFKIDFEYDVSKSIQLIKEIKVDLSAKESFKVLVVEDNRINQLITKKTIEKNNYYCLVVDDGYAALEILKVEDFDVILMDINMPLLNGFETTRRIRELGIETPIIALTAFDKNDVTDEALAAGMNDIIVKPFEPLLLFKIINCLILK